MLVKKKKRHHFKLSDDEIYCLEIHSFIPRVKPYVMMVCVMMHDEGKIHKYVPAAQPTES